MHAVRVRHGSSTQWLIKEGLPRQANKGWSLRKSVKDGQPRQLRRSTVCKVGRVFYSSVRLVTGTLDAESVGAWANCMLGALIGFGV